MAKNKISWANYLIELLVVIIGISIAFAIEKRAERLSEDKEIFAILESFADDLERDIRGYADGQIPYNERKVAELDYILEKLKAEELDDDSLHVNIKRMFGSANSRITNATYESVKSSGKLENITNVALRKQIVNHYQANYSQSDYLSDENTEFSDRLLTYVSDHSDAPFTNDYSDKRLLRDVGFRNMVSRWRSIVNFKVREYKRMTESTEKLLGAINEELGREGN